MEPVAESNRLGGSTLSISTFSRDGSIFPGITYTEYLVRRFEVRGNERLTSSIGEEQPIDFDVPTAVEGVGALDVWSGRGRECFGEHLLTLSLRRKVRQKNGKI
jgi:hypothetical protein